MKKQEQKIVVIEGILSDFNFSFGKNKLLFVDLNKLSFESLQKLQRGISALKSKKLRGVLVENSKKD